LFVVAFLFSCGGGPPVKQRPANSYLSMNEWKEKYDTTNQLAEIEGIWAIVNSTIEIAIYRNQSEMYSDYQYIGIVASVTELPDGPDIEKVDEGHVYFMLNPTAVEGYYKGISRRKPWYSVKTEIASLSIRDDNFLTGKAGDADFLAVRSYPVETNKRRRGSDTTGAYAATGTGFLIGDGWIITNLHVIEGAQDIVAQNENDTYACSLVGRDINNDLAILKAEGLPDSLNNVALSIDASTQLQPGEEVFTIGYPLVEEMGERKKFTAGTVSSTTGIKDDPTMLQVSLQIQPGNSGGPLINSMGSVVGVVTSTINPALIIAKHQTLPQGVNYAVKSIYLKSLVDTFGGEVLEPTVNKRLTPSEVYERSRFAVFLIKAN